MITLSTQAIAKDWPHVLELITEQHEEICIVKGRKTIARIIPEGHKQNSPSFKPEFAGAIIGDISSSLTDHDWPQDKR